MGMAATIRRLVGRFAGNRRGNFGMMAAITTPVLLLAAGYGLNIAQISHARSNLLAALDSAVTSTARDLTTGAISEEDAPALVEAFLFANAARSFTLEDQFSLDSLVIDKTARTVSAKASVELDVVFPLFGAANRQTISAESAALYSDRKIEIVMTLDVTWSMNGQRIRDLRTAAVNAVDTFLGGQNASNPRVRIALVPYATGVNAGPLAHTVHVETQYTPVDVEPPRLNDPVPAGGGAFDACATERKGILHRFTDASPYEARVNRDVRLERCPGAAIMPLTSDADALRARINGLVAETIPAGYTAGHIGVQWSWYLLSRNWASVLPASAAPLPRDPVNVGKFAILMTDGAFNTAFAEVPNGHQNYLHQGPRSRADAERLCEEMKNQGIEIFTIGFAIGNDANARQVMQRCASPDTGSTQHYFEASTGAELDRAYQSIARNIERLALTR